MISKRRLFIICLTLAASAGSYHIARNGIDVAQAVVDSRCSAGAFIAHSTAPSKVQPDSGVSSSTTADGAYAPVNLTSSNLIPNGELETIAGSRPLGWDNNRVGVNDANFSLVSGHNSKTAARVDVTKYNDGTADWFGPELAVTPGSYFQFQDYYRSNTTTHALLSLTDKHGKSQYVSLDSVPASSQWSPYIQRFIIPTNVSKIMISHPLSQAGWLETDNYSLQLAVSPGFSAPMVSLTFDDGWKSIHDTALPLMKQYNVVSTQFLVSGFVGRLKDYMSPGQVYDFTTAGHEVASHTFDHPDLTKLSNSDLNLELKRARDNLSKCYGNVTSFAAPFGIENERTLRAERALYGSARSTNSGFNSPDTFSPYQLKVQNVRADTSPEQMAAWIQTANINHLWLILVYHQVTDSGGEYARKPVDFQTDLILLKASGVDILTIHDANAKAQNESLSQKDLTK